MEHIIAKLLQDFEQGKLNRRQLIQSLALTAMAPAAATAATRLKASSVNHMTFSLHDYTKARDFYADLFGMPVLDDTGIRSKLRCGNTHFNFMNSTADEFRNYSINDTPRVEHIAIGIEKYDKQVVAAELKNRGIQTNPGGTYLSFKDPEGFRVQIVPKNYSGT